MNRWARSWTDFSGFLSRFSFRLDGSFWFIFVQWKCIEKYAFLVELVFEVVIWLENKWVSSRCFEEPRFFCDFRENVRRRKNMKTLSERTQQRRISLLRFEKRRKTWATGARKNRVDRKWFDFRFLCSFNRTRLFVAHWNLLLRSYLPNIQLSDRSTQTKVGGAKKTRRFSSSPLKTFLFCFIFSDQSLTQQETIQIQGGIQLYSFRSLLRETV